MESADLLSKPMLVRGIGTAGREFDEVADGLFRVGGIVIYADPALYVGAEAVEVGSRDEVYPLYVERFDALRHRSRPALQPVETFPSSFPVEPMIGTPLRADIIATVESYGADRETASVLVDTCLLLSSAAGRRLLIESRHAPVEAPRVPVMPLDLVLTCRDDVIEQRLARVDRRTPN